MLKILVALGATIAMTTGQADAALIHLTHTATNPSITGTLDGQAFTTDQVTFSSIGDTTTRTSFGSGFSVVHATSTVTINNLGTFNVLTGTRSFL